MEILEHMKTLKRNGDESKQESKPAAAKVSADGLWLFIL